MCMCVFVYRCVCLCVVCMQECECVGDLRVRSVVCECGCASLRAGVYPRVMFFFVCGSLCESENVRLRLVVCMWVRV